MFEIFYKKKLNIEFQRKKEANINKKLKVD